MTRMCQRLWPALLCICSLAVQAQVPQELIDKAKAAGVSEAQIQQEIAGKMQPQEIGRAHV